jgi:hypothetical protein
MRRGLVLLAGLAVLPACAPSRPLPPPFIANELPPIDPDKGRCIEVEREPGPAGGLRIPRQTVCPTFGVRSQ